LEDFIIYFGQERPCCVSRELTKLYEENQRGSLREVCDYFREKGVKGEIVITVAGAGYAKSGKSDRESSLAGDGEYEEGE
jgi:16S rRNA (cytidine1402-2'-O)-methyltransferase